MNQHMTAWFARAGKNEACLEMTIPQSINLFGGRM